MDPPRVPLTAVNRENQQLPYPAFGNTIGLKATGGSNKSANHRAVKPGMNDSRICKAAVPRTAGFNKTVELTFLISHGQEIYPVGIIR